MKRVIKLSEGQIREAIEGVVKNLFEGGHLYGELPNGDIFTNSKDTFHGVPGSTVVSHGEWADPELFYKGKKVDFEAVEERLYDDYYEEASGFDNVTFEEWLETKDMRYLESILKEYIISGEALNESTLGETPRDKCMRLAMQAREDLTSEQRTEFFNMLKDVFETDDMGLVRSMFAKICQGTFEDEAVIENLIPKLEDFIERVYGPEEQESDDDNDIAGIDSDDEDIDFSSLGAFPDGDLDESHGHKKHNAPRDYIAAVNKGNREGEMEKMGGGFRQRNKIHKVRNDYSGKKVNMSNYDDLIDECVKRVLNKML